MPVLKTHFVVFTVLSSLNSKFANLYKFFCLRSKHRVKSIFRKVWLEAKNHLKQKCQAYKLF